MRRQSPEEGEQWPLVSEVPAGAYKGGVWRLQFLYAKQFLLRYSPVRHRESGLDTHTRQF